MIKGTCYHCSQVCHPDYNVCFECREKFTSYCITNACDRKVTLPYKTCFECNQLYKKPFINASKGCLKKIDTRKTFKACFECVMKNKGIINYPKEELNV